MRRKVENIPLEERRINGRDYAFASYMGSHTPKSNLDRIWLPPKDRKLSRRQPRVMFVGGDGVTGYYDIDRGELSGEFAADYAVNNFDPVFRRIREVDTRIRIAQVLEEIAKDIPVKCRQQLLNSKELQSIREQYPKDKVLQPLTTIVGVVEEMHRYIGFCLGDSLVGYIGSKGIKTAKRHVKMKKGREGLAEALGGEISLDDGRQLTYPSPVNFFEIEKREAQGGMFFGVTDGFDPYDGLLRAINGYDVPLEAARAAYRYADTTRDDDDTSGVFVSERKVEREKRESWLIRKLFGKR